MHKLAQLSIQTRVLILVAVMASMMTTVGVATAVVSRRQATALSDKIRSDRAQFYDRLLTLRGGRMQAVTFDYTYWNEMVDFVKKPDAKWAKESLDTALTTYDIDCMWVFDPSMKPVYTKIGDDPHGLKTLPIPAAARDKILKTGPYYHFFVRTPGGLVEVRGSSIHRSDDFAHSGPALGYFFVARVWDADYVQELGGMTSSRVTIQMDGAVHNVSRGDRLESDKVFTGWDGKKVATLSMVSDDPVASLLGRSSNKFLMLMAVFAIVVLGAISICLYKWVSQPVGKLSRALLYEDLDEVTTLAEGHAEMARLAGLICEFFEQKSELKAAHDLLETRVAERTQELTHTNLKLRAAYDSTIEGWSRALDLRDHETEGHSRRVTEMTLKLARSFGIDEEELVDIERGALLHDIGKMGVPDNILLKPGPLTDTEWVLMRKHPQYALDMLKPITFLSPALDIPYCHHEKWDGTGYPQGLHREQIPLAARMFAAADVWDALVSDRPYRGAWPAHKVRDHIISLSGTHFDPDVIEKLIELTDDMQAQTELLRAA